MVHISSSRNITLRPVKSMIFKNNNTNIGYFTLFINYTLVPQTFSNKQIQSDRQAFAIS